MTTSEREAPASSSGPSARDERRPPDPSRRSSLFRAVAALALVAAAGVGLAAHVGALTPRAAPEELDAASGIHQVQDGRYRYVYEAVFSVESLFDLESDPNCRRNLVAECPEEAARLRAQLLTNLRVASLEDLRRPHVQTIERLRGLGYL